MDDPLPPATPPHHPTYNIHLSLPSVQKICTSVFPSSILNNLSIRTLPHGGSFNNRIYFLSFQSEELHVLKLNGRFFGIDKVQNEVSCMLLLEKCCPEIPVPRVVAWSEDGEEIVVRDGNATRVGIGYVNTKSNDSDGGKGKGWILMTCLPGTPLLARPHR